MSAARRSNQNVEDTVLETWEDIQEEELTNKMRLLKSTATPAPVATETSTTGSSPLQVLRGPTGPAVTGIMRPPPTESVGGAVAPAKPKFTILKRPTTSPSSASSSPLVNGAHVPSPFDEDAADSPSRLNGATEAARDQGTTPTGTTGQAVKRPPVKSLEQRKQEYAEARLRILGDAKFSDDDDDDDEEAKTQSSGFRTGAGGGGGAGPGMRPSNRGGPASQLPPAFNPSVPPPRFDPVIRVPRGPDGTVGFQGRR